MVVISIIGLLSSIILASLNAARAKAQDAQRLQSIRQIQTALELYFHTYGRYPSSNSCLPAGDYAPSPNTGWCNSVNANGGSQWIKNSFVATPPIPNNLSEFISSIPKDPVNNAVACTSGAQNYGFCYFSSSSYQPQNQGYWLTFRLVDKQLENTVSRTIKNFSGGVCNTMSRATYTAAIVGVSPPMCP